MNLVIVKFSNCVTGKPNCLACWQITQLPITNYTITKSDLTGSVRGVKPANQNQQLLWLAISILLLLLEWKLQSQAAFVAKALGLHEGKDVEIVVEMHGM